MSKPLDTITALIIEDDENNLLVTQRLLQLSGIGQVFSARSVREALGSIQTPVDLVLLDINLGEENGLALLPQVRADGHFQSAVIAALTANILPQELQRVRQVGFDGLLGKPLNFERFPKQLKCLLDGKSVWQTR